MLVFVVFLCEGLLNDFLRQEPLGYCFEIQNLIFC
jgi:hypothetical protein